MNPGPTDLLRFGLPHGFQSRVETRQYGGLTLRIAGRFDQICFKLYAAVDQGMRSKHAADLQALQPTHEELLAAARWSRSHDPSVGYRQELVKVLTALGLEDTMARFSEQMQEHALDLAWSLWAELGVSGWSRMHSSHSIDPELLILFTSFLRDADPRLRDESIDWCISYGRYVSAARLKNLLAKDAPEVKAAFGEFAATVNAHSGLRWPGPTQPHRFQRTGRSEVPDFRRPSLIVLRVRALFGVGARAEIVRAFVADPSMSLSAADLATEAGYTKRNVAEALDALRMAGLLEAVPVRNQLLYRVARPGELVSLLRELPSSFPRWRSIFRIIERLLQTAQRGENLTPTVRAVEAAKLLHDLGDDLRAVAAPGLATDREQDQWDGLERWAVDLTKAWASGSTEFAEVRSV